MANELLNEAKATQRAKMQRIAGSAASYQHPTDKANSRYTNSIYYENSNLDPTPLPTREKGSL